MSSPINDYFIDYNPLFPIFATRIAKGLAIYRVSDHARLAVIPIRNINLVANYDWDTTTGKFLSIFFKDGTIRIHDIFKDGRLVSFLRIPSTKISKGIWDRIPLRYEPNNRDFACNIIDDLPKLIRFVKDSKRINIVPYTQPNSLWRGPDEDDLDSNEKLDVHVVFNEGNDKITVFFNGDYAVFLSVDNIENENSLKSIIKVQDGFTSASMRMELLRIWKLKSELEALFLLGEISCDLEDWLCNSVGEKNFKRWKYLGCEAYQKTVQILTLIFVPACERIIIYVEKLRAILQAFSIQNKLSYTSDLTAVEVLLKSSQKLLTMTLNSIIGLGRDETLFEKFFIWFNDRLHEALDEDYKLKFQFEDDLYFGYDLLSYFDRILSKKGTEPSSIIDVKLYRDLINSMSDMEKDIAQSNVNSHIQQHILVDLKTDVFAQKYPSSQINLLDAIKLPKHNYIVYVVQVTKHNSAQEPFSEENKKKLYIGTLKDENLGIISKESSVKIPALFKSYRLSSTRFVPNRVHSLLRDIELSDSNYHSSHVTDYRGENYENEEDDGTIAICLHQGEWENDDFIACTAKVSVDGRSASLVFPKEKQNV
ncbi:Anaphase-promoting complex, cyclosome, subunit 4 family protein [Saccharomyces cerevisiae]|nr:Anaphase-promoting complex, cyclosome, subunit 4 family protein [Saccharomyces cerevisiae]